MRGNWDTREKGAPQQPIKTKKKEKNAGVEKRVGVDFCSL